MGRIILNHDNLKTRSQAPLGKAPSRNSVSHDVVKISYHFLRIPYYPSSFIFREELLTTSRLLPAMARAANRGLIRPAIARGMAVAL